MAVDQKAVSKGDWDLATKLQDTGHGTVQAAEIVGLSPSDLRNWLDRFGLFSEKRAGSGAYLSFRLSDLFKLATIKALVEQAGLSPREAVAAINPFSPYGTFIHSPNPIFTLSRAQDGRWQAAYSTDTIVRLEIHLLPLWQSFKARLAEKVGDDLVAAFDRTLVF